MFIRKRIAALVLILVSAAVPLHSAAAQSQIVRGRVVIAATEAPLIGALVQVRRATGEVVTTTSTSESGSFTIQSLLAGTYAVRVLRIGFRPFDAGSITVTENAATILNLSWRAVPIPLATRLVKGEAACKISADSGTLIANVWEETRKALLSSMIAEQSEVPELERVNFERYVDTTGILIQQDVSFERSKSFRAYASWVPDSLALHGYVSVQGTTFAIVGPDASVLVSDSFAGTHCFALAENPIDHPNDIGLAFTPIKSKNKDRVDIAGTFWIDRTTWALRSVDYRYEGGLFQKDSEIAGIRRAGGNVTFGSLTTGQWLVTDWHIRRPILDPAVTFSLQQKTDVRIVGNSYVAGIDESGGFVTRIAQNGTTQIVRTLPTLTLQVVSHDPFVKTAGVQIRIKGIDTVFTLDQTGKLTLPSFLDGKFALNATFPSIASFAPIDARKDLSVRGADVTDTIYAPTLEGVARARCGAETNLTTNSALFGTLTLKQQRAPGVYLVVEWPIPEKERKDERTVTGRAVVTNTDGRFLVCDVPRGPVVVRASIDVSSVEKQLTLNSADAIQQVEVDLLPKPEFESRPPAANVEIQLLDAGNNPLSTKISVTEATGRKFSVTTDKSGRVLLPDQPVGLLKLMIGKQLVQQQLAPGYNLMRFVVPKL